MLANGRAYHHPGCSAGPAELESPLETSGIRPTDRDSPSRSSLTRPDRLRRVATGDGRQRRLSPHRGRAARSFLLRAEVSLSPSEGQCSELGFLQTKTPLDPYRGPRSNSPPGCLKATGGPTAQSFRNPASPPEPLRSSRPQETAGILQFSQGPTASPPWNNFRISGSKRNREFPRLRKFSPFNDERKKKTD